MDSIRMLMFLCFMAPSTLAWNVTNLQVCYSKVLVTKSLSEFEKCVNAEVTDDKLKGGILPLENATMKQFSCCFDDLTSRLVKTNLFFKAPKILVDKRIVNHSEIMIRCSITGDSYSTVKLDAGKRYRWSLTLPPVVQKDIIAHHRCRTSMPGDDIKACCAKEYHDKVEEQLTENCVKQAMVCKMKKNMTSVQCNDGFDKCIQREYCNLGDRNPSYSTPYARSVLNCSEHCQTIEDKLLCIVKDTNMASTPLVAYQYAYCAKEYTGANDVQKFFDCATKIPSVTLTKSTYHQCYTPQQKSAHSR